ncbi:MAG: hypothetical protein OXU79_21230 [Gemmatimonadota bacterium]|nr:hypothetical protein [Gemmatimonadota bacterium]
MVRTVSIILISAILFQTVECATNRPLSRANEYSQDNDQPSIGDQALGKLKEGMHVRIRIRQGTTAPIKGQVFEGIVEEIGQTSLTVTPVAFYVRNAEKKPFTLPYADIVGIEYRDANDLAAFVGGVGFGVGLAFFLVWLAFSQW